jgi:hypothetical protein
MKNLFHLLILTVVCTCAISLLSACTTIVPVPEPDLENGENAADVMHLYNESVIASNQTAPQAYRSEASTHAVNPNKLKSVEGTACQKGFSVPLGPPQGVGYSSSSGLTYYASSWPSFKWGQGGVADAIADIEENYGAIDQLLDVKVDTHHWGLLIYREQCVVVSAKALLKEKSL